MPLNTTFEHLIDLRIDFWARLSNIFGFHLVLYATQVEDMKDVALLLQEGLLHLDIFLHLIFGLLLRHLVFKPFILELQLSQIGVEASNGHLV